MRADRKSIARREEGAQERVVRAIVFRFVGGCFVDEVECPLNV